MSVHDVMNTLTPKLSSHEQLGSFRINKPTYETNLNNIDKVEFK